MPRRLFLGRSTRRQNYGTSVRCAHFGHICVGATLDRQPPHGLSSCLLRDIGLSGQSTGDGEEPWKRLK